MRNLLIVAAVAAAVAVPTTGNAQHAYPPNTQVVTNAPEGETQLFAIEGGTSTGREATVFNTPELVGKKIYALESWGYILPNGNPWAENMTRNMYGYIGAGMPELNSKKGSASSYLADGKFYVAFPDGVDVPEGDFTAGVWHDKGSNTPVTRFVACLEGVGTPNGIWAKCSPVDWKNYSDIYGPVPLKIYVGEPGLDPSFSMAVGKIQNQEIDRPGKTFTIPVVFRNDGWSNNADFTYVFKVDGKQIGEENKIEKTTWRGGDLQPGVPYSTTVTVPSFPADGTYTVTLEVILVDDVDNESPEGSSTFIVKVGDGGSTAVENVKADPEAIVKYYDLSGRQVRNLSHGVYIRLTNGKAEKVML